MNRVASPRRALYGGILLSLVLLWCTALGALPARAAADPSVQAPSDCACCNPASGMPECASVCNAPQQTAIKDVALPPSAPFSMAAAQPAPVKWEDAAAPLRPARTLLAGPPRYLRLHRLLN